MITDATFNQFYVDEKNPESNDILQDVYVKEGGPRDAFMYLCAWQSEIDAGHAFTHINDSEDSIYVLGANSPYLFQLNIEYEPSWDTHVWYFEFYMPYVEQGKTDELIPVALIDRRRNIILRNPGI